MRLSRMLSELQRLETELGGDVEVQFEHALGTEVFPFCYSISKVWAERMGEDAPVIVILTGGTGEDLT